MEKDKKYWESRFSKAEFIFGKEPDAFLHEMIPRLRKGKVLDVAMGEGRNAAYLALKGFNVLGFDTAEPAVQKAKQLAKDSGVSIEAHVKDVDFYLFPIMSFDSIVMTFFKPVSRYFSEIRKSLVQGGTFVCVGYLTEQANSNHAGEAVALEECFKPNELLQHLSGLRILHYEEGEVDGVYVVKCLAKKPQEKDAVKYGFSKGEIHKSAHETAAENLFKKKS
jgi:tellurite methyltransferase